MRQQQGRFWLGCGAVLLPYLAINLGAAFPLETMKQAPTEIQFGIVVSVITLSIAAGTCWIAGLVPWDD